MLLPTNTKAPVFSTGAFVLCGDSDDDLLSRGIPRTIIGAASFHGPVRYGKAWGQRAMVVREDGGKADLGSAPQHASGSTTLEEVKNSGSVMESHQALLVKHRTKACGYRIKPHGQLVRLSLTCYHASTRRLSTSWSRTTL